MVQTSARAAEKPLGLHPDNPHYFLFRGKPAVLITSGEHYGAVLNTDFDFIPYLDELKRHRFNLTRTFSGTYREVPGSFGIVDNTLAPTAKRYACPWARGATPGALDGGNKFDLNAYDKSYFTRLKEFITAAGKRGIVVELVLFCTIYDDKLWRVSPMNPANNTAGLGKVGRTEVFTLKHPKLLAAQEALVRRIVAELKDHDNLYYEVCNEPYFGGVTKEWNDRIVAAIRAAEKGLPHPHLIAQNISNGSVAIKGPNPHVSVFNFHYCSPPDAVALNAKLKRPVAFDETGFRGTADRPYRTDAWDFLLAGGAVYSNLDYSFTPRHPGGTFKVTTSPGGGGASLRKQLGFLKQFMDSLDLVKMRPANDLLKGGSVRAPLEGAPARAAVTARVLAEAGKTYAVYVNGGTKAELRLDMPAGSYTAEWLNPRTGKVDRREEFRHGGGPRALASPAYEEDIALRVRRKEG